MGHVKRWAAKRDGNEKPIRAALEAVGASVQQLSGKDIPDLLVGYADPYTGERKNLLMEIKMPGEELREGQAEWHEAWQGQVAVVETVEQALALIGR